MREVPFSLCSCSGFVVVVCVFVFLELSSLAVSPCFNYPPNEAASLVGVSC